MLLCIWRTSTACIRFVYEWQYRVPCNTELKRSTLNKKLSKVNTTPTNITGIKAWLAKTCIFLLFQTLKKTLKKTSEWLFLFLLLKSILHLLNIWKYFWKLGHLIYFLSTEGILSNKKCLVNLLKYSKVLKKNKTTKILLGHIKMWECIKFAVYSKRFLTNIMNHFFFKIEICVFLQKHDHH